METAQVVRCARYMDATNEEIQKSWNSHTSKDETTTLEQLPISFRRTRWDALSTTTSIPWTMVRGRTSSDDS
jgi:hypothetical protein